MYCKYCGKFTVNENCMCNGCAIQPEYIVIPPEEDVPREGEARTPRPAKARTPRAPRTPRPVVYTRGHGLADALIACAVALNVFILYEMYEEVSSVLGEAAWVWVILWMTDIAFAISAMRKYKNAKRHGVTPHATFLFAFVALLALGLTMFLFIKKLFLA